MRRPYDLSQRIWSILMKCASPIETTSPIEALDVDVDGAAAGEADLPGQIGGDAVVQQLRPARLEDRLRLLEDGALQAAAGDGADHLAAAVDRQLGAARPGRGALRADDGRDRDRVAA